MKLSTRSRYGTRLMVDLAEHYDQGPVQLGDIARRQNISVKYLEQIIIPLKKANYIESIRGPKGGHILTRPPHEINVGEIVALLEEGSSLTECSENAGVCERADICPTRLVWKEASEAMFDKLQGISLADLAARARGSAKTQAKSIKAETARHSQEAREESCSSPLLFGASQGD
jgi:Rrf2 family protein